jgi:hypothetical protein
MQLSLDTYCLPQSWNHYHSCRRWQLVGPPCVCAGSPAQWTLAFMMPKATPRSRHSKCSASKHCLPGTCWRSCKRRLADHPKQMAPKGACPMLQQRLTQSSKVVFVVDDCLLLTGKKKQPARRRHQYGRCSKSFLCFALLF